MAYTGGAGRSTGNSDEAALIAACTSCSATSSVRSRSNCSVTRDAPEALVLEATFDANTLARGVHDAVDAEVSEILRR